MTAGGLAGSLSRAGGTGRRTHNLCSKAAPDKTKGCTICGGTPRADRCSFCSVEGERYIVDGGRA
jgi:hypothetical protein